MDAPGGGRRTEQARITRGPIEIHLARAEADEAVHLLLYRLANNLHINCRQIRA
jgi:hypothetical protein